jgi:alkylation response protein AidB-like acyl-CoA dehydrogenase
MARRISDTFKSILDLEIELGEEHELFRKNVRDFVESKVMPRWREIEESNNIPDDLWRDIVSAGFLGIGIPEEYGGQGGDMRTTVILIEELSRGVAAVGSVASEASLFTPPLLRWGSEYLKKKYIPPVAKGEARGAHANTEPGAGSDVAAIQTVAKKINGHYVITGRKIFITGAGEANYILVSARTEPPKPDKRWWGITAFIIEKDWPGVKIGRQLKIMGVKGEHHYEVFLDDVKVPEENIVGSINEGFKVLMDSYNYSRLYVAAISLGIAQAAFERALDYSIMRETFGQKIISHGMITEKIADMYIKLQASRLLTYWAATLADKNKPEFPLASSAAKAFASEAAEWIARQAMQIHGGYGVDFETGVEKYLRDAIIQSIVDGTNEIQRLTIVRQLLKLLNIKI